MKQEVENRNGLRHSRRNVLDVRRVRHQTADSGTTWGRAEPSCNPRRCPALNTLGADKRCPPLTMSVPKVLLISIKSCPPGHPMSLAPGSESLSIQSSFLLPSAEERSSHASCNISSSLPAKAVEKRDCCERPPALRGLGKTGWQEGEAETGGSMEGTLWGGSSVILPSLRSEPRRVSIHRFNIQDRGRARFVRRELLAQPRDSPKYDTQSSSFLLICVRAAQYAAQQSQHRKIALQ